MLTVCGNCCLHCAINCANCLIRSSPRFFCKSSCRRVLPDRLVIKIQPRPEPSGARGTFGIAISVEMPSASADADRITLRIVSPSSAQANTLGAGTDGQYFSCKSRHTTSFCTLSRPKNFPETLRTASSNFGVRDCELGESFGVMGLSLTKYIRLLKDLPYSNCSTLMSCALGKARLIMDEIVEPVK